MLLIKNYTRVSKVTVFLILVFPMSKVRPEILWKLRQNRLKTNQSHIVGRGEPLGSDFFSQKVLEVTIWRYRSAK